LKFEVRKSELRLTTLDLPLDVVVVVLLLTDHGGATSQSSLRATVEIINGRSVAVRILKLSTSIYAS